MAKFQSPSIPRFPARRTSPGPLWRYLPLAGAWRYAFDHDSVGHLLGWFRRELRAITDLPGTDAVRAGHRGVVWYQRWLEVPGNWRGRRMELRLGEVSGACRVWLGDREVLMTSLRQESVHAFDLGPCEDSGLHRLTLRIDNREEGPAGNGVGGLLELHQTPLTWIDELRVASSAEARSIWVSGRVAGREIPGEVRLEARLGGGGVRYRPTARLRVAEDGTFSGSLVLGSDARASSPGAPVEHLLDAILPNGHWHQVRFCLPDPEPESPAGVPLYSQPPPCEPPALRPLP